MAESKGTESEKEDPKVELMVDAPAGAEAFAASEGHESHHALVGVEQETINVGLVLAVVLGTVVIVSVLVAFAFTMTEVTSRQTQALLIAQTDYPDLREARATAADRLTQYKVVNAEAGRYQIPIDRAINLILNEQYQGQGDNDRSYSSELTLLPD